VQPAAARYDQTLSEFIVMYDDIRTAASPTDALLTFCQSTYEAGARAANWDRDSLERSKPQQ
jgi:DNA-binding LacI/PurR family transcriptional regulator